MVMKHEIVCKYILKTLLLAEFHFLFQLFLSILFTNRPICDKRVINFIRMNLFSNVLDINPSLFRPTS